MGFESKSEEAVKALLSEQDFLSLLLVATDQFSSLCFRCFFSAFMCGLLFEDDNE